MKYSPSSNTDMRIEEYFKESTINFRMFFLSPHDISINSTKEYFQPLPSKEWFFI